MEPEPLSGEPSREPGKARLEGQNSKLGDRPPTASPSPSGGFSSHVRIKRRLSPTDPHSLCARRYTSRRALPSAIPSFGLGLIHSMDDN
ncbi:hypothetical protein E2562_035912, partial [Oryza meyeriana var. granulata]